MPAGFVEPVACDWLEVALEADHAADGVRVVLVEIVVVGDFRRDPETGNQFVGYIGNDTEILGVVIADLGVEGGLRVERDRCATQIAQSPPHGA